MLKILLDYVKLLGASTNLSNQCSLVPGPLELNCCLLLLASGSGCSFVRLTSLWGFAKVPVRTLHVEVQSVRSLSQNQRGHQLTTKQFQHVQPETKNGLTDSE